MKTIFISILILLSPEIICQSYPHLFELRGLEDSLGNTQLFYRYGNPGEPSIINCWSKSIYHLNVTDGSDSLFIYDAASNPIGMGCGGVYIYDYEFFSNDPQKYFYCGVGISIDPVPILVRFDTLINFDTFGGIQNIEISKQNENLLFLVLNDNQLLKSTDGGYYWEINLDSLAIVDNALISLSKNDDSQIYGTDNFNLVRSTDNGNSYTIVNNYGVWDENTKLFYDVDGQHIYGITYYQDYSSLQVSGGNGDPFTWNTSIEIAGQIPFTIDETQSGEIYYTTSKHIFKSTDYGTTFTFYRMLERKITGLYKKSGSEILYASTPLKIYEITPDTIQIIKELPIPQQILDWYPLAIGNKWIYEETTVTYNPYPNYFHTIVVREVERDTIAQNGKLYYVIRDGTTWNNFVLERVDTNQRKVYRYDETAGLPDDEYVIDDLLAEVGDTLLSYRMGYYEGSFTTVLDEVTFQKWGLVKPKKVYEAYILHPPVYSLTQDIGLDSIYFYFDFGETWRVLKGCVIDGILYGDTLTVLVNDGIENLPFDFSLSQNYPNPFNPTTKIKFTIPDLRLATLKVYDVLGNEIATLVNEEKPASKYEIEFDATGLSSGIYFYQLKAGSFVRSKKMVVIK